MVGMTDSPTVIKVSTHADLLAMLPGLAGMPLRNSIAIAPFMGKRTPAVIRMDLPPRDDPDGFKRVASVLLGYASKMKECDGVAIAIYTDDAFPDAFDSWFGLQDQLVERFDSAGFHIMASLCVAEDGWAPFDEQPPPGGHPLSLIEESPAGMHDAPHVDVGKPLPDPDPALARAVETALVDLLEFGEERTGLGLYRPAELPEPVEFLERALDAGPTDLSAAALARLIALIRTEGDVDRTVLQIAFGRDVGAESWKNTLAVRELARANGEEPFEYRLREARAGTRGSNTDRFGGMLCGQTEILPSPGRIEEGIALLSHVAAHCPVVDRLFVQCALAWLHWARGMGSIAGGLLDDIARIHPRHSLAGVFQTIFSAVPLPEWVFNRPIPGEGNRASRRAAAR